MQTKLSVLVIDDEKPARDLVLNYLADYPDIELLGECEDGFSAVKAINERKPDVVILDIQMPKLTGLEVLELLEYMPAVIFSTAYDQYAIKAFELNAVDYLLKPFSRERFDKAIRKVYENTKADKQVTEKLINTYNDQVENIERVAVRSNGRIHVLPVSDILFIEADGDYVKIHTRQGAFLKEKTMKYFETYLQSSIFVRIHRSTIVNVNEVKKLEPYGKDTYILHLRNEQKLNVSYNGYKKLREIINL